MVRKSVRRKPVTAADLKAAQAQNKTKKRKRKSLTRAAQQRFIAQARKRGLTKRGADNAERALPAAPTKLQQLDAKVRAGVVSNPLPHEPATGTAISLTARVRALYEDGLVPVREIARLCGVSERTLYKYAARGRWRGRHARRALINGAKRGAGGRFVAADAAGEPQACGLKALDPIAAAAAAAVCDEAGRVAARAAAVTLADHAAREQREATLREFETRVRRLALLAQSMKLAGVAPARALR